MKANKQSTVYTPMENVSDLNSNESLYKNLYFRYK